MTRIAKDPDREERISMEIVVDAYEPEEQALGWYYYFKRQNELSLQSNLHCQKA
jgi:hypothetical protein